MPGQGAAAVAYVCGTFDTKAAELHYLAELLRAAGPRDGDGRPGHAGAGRRRRRGRRRGRGGHHPEGVDGRARGATIAALP